MWPSDFKYYQRLAEYMMTDQDDSVVNQYDQAVMWFPSVFYCRGRHFGPSGTIVEVGIRCTTQLASWVEAFFIANIFMLWILALLWVINFCGTTLYLFLFPLYHNSRRKKPGVNFIYILQRNFSYECGFLPVHVTIKNDFRTKNVHVKC